MSAFTGPLEQLVAYTGIQLASAISLASPPSPQTGMQRARSIYIENAGDGTLVVVDQTNHTLTRFGIESGSYLEPGPAFIKSIGGDQAVGDVSAFVIEDVGTGFTTETTDANSATVADVTMMPAADAAGDRGLIGSTQPFNAVDIILSTVGVGSTMIWKYYAGDPVTYATAAWTALSGVRESVAGSSSLLASGRTRWRVPTDWQPATINALGPYYWVAYELVGAYSTNPVGSRIQIANQSTVQRLIVGY